MGIKNATEQNNELNRLIICPICHTLHEKIRIENGKRARCKNCKNVLYRYDENTLQKGLAFGITGLILFLVSNMFPLVKIELLGHEQHVTIISMILSMFENGFYVVGVVVAFVVLIFPAIILIIYIISTWLMMQKKGRHATKELLIMLSKILPWNMIEIYLVSILVALVKLIGYVQIHFGLSFWSLVAFVLLDIYLTKSINIGELWDLRHRIYCDR